MARKYRENDAAVGRDLATGGAQYAKTYSGNITKYRMQDENEVRIMPRTWEDDEGPKHWAIPLFFHGQVGADNEVFACPTKHDGSPCPICEARAEVLATATTQEDKDYEFQLKPYPRFACWIIDRNDESAGPKLAELPAKKVHAEIQQRSVGKHGAVLDIVHPENGYDVSWNRAGKGKLTQYTGVDIARDSSYLADDAKKEDEWLDYIEAHPIPSLLVVHPYEKIAAAFGQRQPQRGDDDDEGYKTRTRSSRDEEDEPRGRRSSRDEEDEPRGRRSSRDEEDEPRGRRSSRDEEDEPRGRRSSRDEEDETRGRRSSRDEEDEPRGRRSSRDEEDEPRGRRSSRDEEDEPRGRRSSRDEEDEPRGRRSSRDEEDEPRGRRRAPIDDAEESLMDDPKDEGRDREEPSRSRRDGDGSRSEGRSLRDRVSDGLGERD